MYPTTRHGFSKGQPDPTAEGGFGSCASDGGHLSKVRGGTRDRGAEKTDGRAPRHTFSPMQVSPAAAPSRSDTGGEPQRAGDAAVRGFEQGTQRVTQLQTLLQSTT